MFLTFTEEVLKATNATLAEQGSGPLPVEILADGSSESSPRIPQAKANCRLPPRLHRNDVLPNGRPWGPRRATH